MDKLKIVKQKAKDLGLKGEIKPSTVKGKKYDYIKPDGTKVSFGAKGYSDYIEHMDKERRDKYHKRFSKVKNYNVKESANWLSAKILW